MKKPVMMACTVVGSLSLVTGIVGVFVPGLPTTPFVLLAILAYMHCSPRFVSWFNRQPLCRSYLDDFLRERSMTRRNKAKTLIIGTLMISISFFLLEPLWARVLILVVMAVKYYYVLFGVWTKVEEGHGICAEQVQDQVQDQTQKQEQKTGS